MSLDYHWSDIPPGTSPEQQAYINQQRGIFEGSIQHGGQFGRAIHGGAPIVLGAASGGIPGFLAGGYRSYQNMRDQGNSVIPGLFGGGGGLSNLLPLLIAGGLFSTTTQPKKAASPSGGILGGLYPQDGMAGYMSPIAETNLQRVAMSE